MISATWRLTIFYLLNHVFQIQLPASQLVLFDNEFTKLFKKLEGKKPYLIDSFTSSALDRQGSNFWMMEEYVIRIPFCYDSRRLGPHILWYIDELPFRTDTYTQDNQLMK